MDSRQLTEVPVFFTPADSASWDADHENRSGFAEAIAAAHFVKLGYQVLRDFCTVDREWKPSNPVKLHSTQLLHHVVGERTSDFLCGQLQTAMPRGDGEPDLFVFRESKSTPGTWEWFFAEVKGPRDSVRTNQLAYWGLIEDELGPGLVKLIRVAPERSQPVLNSVSY